MKSLLFVVVICDSSGGARDCAGCYGTNGVVFGAAAAATLTLATPRGCA